MCDCECVCGGGEVSVCVCVYLCSLTSSYTSDSLHYLIVPHSISSSLLSFLPPALLPLFHLHSYLHSILFLTSIVDGRYNEQKNRLQECGLKTCMYIVEGLTLTGNVLYRIVHSTTLPSFVL